MNDNWPWPLSCCCRSVVSDSVWPQRRQPPRLPRPWDSPGKSTGVGCHCLLQCRRVKSQREVAQSCPTLSDPMDCSAPVSSIHGILQARVLEWGAIAFSSAGEWKVKGKSLSRVQLLAPGSSIHGILQARVLEWAAFAFSGGNPEPGFWGQAEVSDSNWYKCYTNFLFKMSIGAMQRKFYALQLFAFRKHFRYQLQICERIQNVSNSLWWWRKVHRQRMIMMTIIIMIILEYGSESYLDTINLFLLLLFCKKC